MKEFEVTITETLQKSITVEAATKEEAQAMVEEMWDNRKLSEQITKLENNDIIGMVREIGMTPEQLAALLSGRTADVPGTEDPDEHEETEEYEHEN